MCHSLAHNLMHLLIHSLTHSLTHLGEISVVISPNYEHLKYAQAWSEEYPTAIKVGPAGIRTLHSPLFFPYVHTLPTQV